MRILRNFLISGISLLFSACQILSGSEETKCPPRQGKFILAIQGKCDTIKEQGIKMEVRFWVPAAENSASAVIGAFLNKIIVDKINACAEATGTDTIARNYNNIAAAYQAFRNNYNAIKAGYPEVPGCYEINLRGDTLMLTSKIIQYQVDQYAFTGGAHPAISRAYYLFDTATGKEIKKEGFISDSTALLKKVEAAFRNAGNLADTTDLEKAGYFLTDHQFFLPSDYAYSREGIIFHYHTYEIAPYAHGSITFTIPYNALKGIVKEELIF